VSTTSYPETLAELADAIGEAGRRLDDIDAVEAGAGNISAAFDWPVDLAGWFDASRDIALPHPSPALAGYTVLVTGGGCRLRQVARQPRQNLGAVRVHPGGLTGALHYLQRGNFQRPTVEFNSHLAVHQDQISRHGLSLHAVVHAQPPYLTFLSHIPRYQSTAALNRSLLRWQSETVVHLPEGVGYLDFMVPGSDELTRANAAHLSHHRLVLWAKHGVMARSSASPLQAVDLIEYVETAARYEYLNLAAGHPARGLSAAEFGRVVQDFAVETDLRLPD
jgi:rhamnulose-1-phosphate aldolase